MGFGQKGTSIVVASAVISMSVEVIVLAARHYLRESKCEVCSDAACIVAVAGCLSCKQVSLTKGLLELPLLLAFWNYKDRVVVCKIFVIFSEVEGRCQLPLNHRL